MKLIKFTLVIRDLFKAKDVALVTGSNNKEEYYRVVSADRASIVCYKMKWWMILVYETGLLFKSLWRWVENNLLWAVK